MRAKNGSVFWFTGLPSSGKTTLSKALKKYLDKNGKAPAILLDGDVLRKSICKDLSFSKQDRNKNIERTAHLAKMLAKNGLDVIVSFISPYRKMRHFARKICPNFIEIYVKCDLKNCIERDVKGLYRKALKGEIKNLTGVQDPYEEPKNPEIILETDRCSVRELTKKLIKLTKK